MSKIELWARVGVFVAMLLLLLASIASTRSNDKWDTPTPPRPHTSVTSDYNGLPHNWTAPGELEEQDPYCIDHESAECEDYEQEK